MFGDDSLPKAQIGEIAKVGSGATPKKGEARFYENGTIPWVTSGQLGGPFVTEHADMITEVALKETSVKLWPEGTLLVAMYGEGKTRGHCSELTFSATSNQACAAIVLVEESPITSTFLKTYLMTQYEQNRRLAAGGVQPNLNLGLIKKMRVPIAPPEQVDEFEAIVSKVQAATVGTNAQSLSIDKLFASLQQRAFRGEL